MKLWIAVVLLGLCGFTSVVHGNDETTNSETSAASSNVEAVLLALEKLGLTSLPEGEIQRFIEAHDKDADGSLDAHEMKGLASDWTLRLVGFFQTTVGTFVGVLAGMFLVLLPQLIFVVVFYVFPHLTRLRPWPVKKPYQEVMSQSGVKNIKEMCAHEDSESTLWFCAVVGRLFADLHDTKIQSFFDKFVRGEIEDIYRERVGCFVGPVRLLSADLGASAPAVTAVRVVRESNADEDVKIAADLALEGPILLHIDTYVDGLELPIEISLQITNVKGTLLLAFSSDPENTIAFGFPEVPSLDVKAELLIGGRTVGNASQMIKKAILSKIQKKFVLPHLKYKYILFDPLKSAVKTGELLVESRYCTMKAVPALETTDPDMRAVWVMLKPRAFTFYDHKDVDKPFGSIPIGSITSISVAGNDSRKLTLFKLTYTTANSTTTSITFGGKSEECVEGWLSHLKPLVEETREAERLREYEDVDWEEATLEPSEREISSVSAFRDTTDPREALRAVQRAIRLSESVLSQLKLTAQQLKDRRVTRGTPEYQQRQFEMSETDNLLRLEKAKMKILHDRHSFLQKHLR